MQVSETAAGQITETDNHVTYTCDFVAVATGHHTIPVLPSFPDQKSFKGRVVALRLIDVISF